jgi:hypothetical protein
MAVASNVVTVTLEAGPESDRQILLRVIHLLRNIARYIRNHPEDIDRAKILEALDKVEEVLKRLADSEG